MEINVKPKPYLLFNAFHLFFVIQSVQVGVGLPGFQRIIFMESGHDAWISILLAGLASHFVVMIMIATLNRYESADLFGIHHDIYGQWLGRIANTIYIAYFILFAIVVFRAYIEIVQAWLFPELPLWIIALFGLFFSIYAIQGGIRVVIGLSVLSLLLTLWMIFLLYFPIQYAHWNSLLPILETPVQDLIKGAYKMTFTIVGFEILYFIYPYIKEKEKTTLYTHLSLLFTTILYLVVMLVTLSYFSGDQLVKTIWATLSMFKIVKLPFIERFEIIAISLWMIVVLPNAVFPLWIASRGIKRIYGFKQRHSLYIISGIVFVALILMKTRDQINMVFDWFGNNGFYLIFIYPIILYALVILIHKKRRKKGHVISEETKSSP